MTTIIIGAVLLILILFFVARITWNVNTGKREEGKTRRLEIRTNRLREWRQNRKDRWDIIRSRQDARRRGQRRTRVIR